MSKDNLIELKNPEPFVDDPITEILRNGAKKLLKFRTPKWGLTAYILFILLHFLC